MLIVVNLQQIPFDREDKNDGVQFLSIWGSFLHEGSLKIWAVAVLINVFIHCITTYCHAVIVRRMFRHGYLIALQNQHFSTFIFKICTTMRLLYSVGSSGVSLLMTLASGVCTQKKFCWHPTSHPQSQLQTLVLYTLVELQTCTCEQDSSEILVCVIFPQ
jgi:hypothetical protein